MKKLSALMILGMAFCFCACDESSESSKFSWSCVNDDCTCEGNGSDCVDGELLVCKDGVVSFQQSESCIEH